jgi:hypothetical protein
MAKEPQARFQTPAELAAALLPFAVQIPTSLGDAAPAPATPGGSLTPSGDISSVPEFTGPGSDPESALSGTVGEDWALTPVCASELPSVRLRWEAAGEQRRRLLLALAVATALVAGLAGLAGLLLLP